METREGRKGWHIPFRFARFAPFCKQNVCWKMRLNSTIEVFRLQIPSLLVNRCLQNAIDQQYMYSSQVISKWKKFGRVLRSQDKYFVCNKSIRYVSPTFIFYHLLEIEDWEPEGILFSSTLFSLSIGIIRMLKSLLYTLSLLYRFVANEILVLTS